MLFLIHRFHLYLTYKYPKKSNPLGFVDCVDILAVRLTQSLSNHSLRDCQLSSASDLSTASTSSQFALPKALQPNASRSVGFFNAHLLIQASLIRNFTLKKPVTYVTGFVARPGFEPGTSGL